MNNNTLKNYLVTKHFESGIMEGLTRTELYRNYSEAPKVGFRCKPWACNPSGYVITKVEEVQS